MPSTGIEPVSQASEACVLSVATQRVVTLWVKRLVLVHPVGIEPALQASEACVLSVERRVQISKIFSVKVKMRLTPIIWQ